MEPSNSARSNSLSSGLDIGMVPVGPLVFRAV